MRLSAELVDMDDDDVVVVGRKCGQVRYVGCDDHNAPLLGHRGGRDHGVYSLASGKLRRPDQFPSLLVCFRGA